MCKKDYETEKPLPDERLKNFFKKSCVWQKDRRSTKCKTVTCVSERRVNLSLHGVWSGCVRRDFGKTLLRYFCTKARGTSLWPKLQLWNQSVSASVVNPTAFLPLHTSQCTSGDDAFATQIPSTNRSLRFTGVGGLCGNQHQVNQVCVLVRYRKRVTPLTAKCLQLVLTDTSCPWNPISSFSRDVSTIPVHVSAR